jgi:heme-degrading monooxygenase HmoA
LKILTNEDINLESQREENQDQVILQSNFDNDEAISRFTELGPEKVLHKRGGMSLIELKQITTRFGMVRTLAKESLLMPLWA